MCKCSEILDEMTKTLDTIYCDSSEGGEVRGLYDAMKGILGEAKSRISALGDGWIESSTKPKEGFYLTYNTIGAIFETYYHPHTGWCTGGSIKETEITHYQPLINPPNK